MPTRWSQMMMMMMALVMVSRPLLLACHKQASALQVHVPRMKYLAACCTSVMACQYAAWARGTDKTGME
jgi:uncharacterized lipoprotein NlpE involved in copper resistance